MSTAATPNLLGRWFLSGRKKSSIIGTVLFDEGLPRLIVHVAHNSTDATALAGFHAFPPNEPRLRVIHGRDRLDNPVTLFGCGEPMQSVSAGLTTYTLEVLAVLLGQEIESWDQPFFQTATVNLTHLHRWLDQPFVKRKGSGTRSMLQVSEPFEVMFELEPGVRMAFQQEIHSNCSWDEESIKQGAHVGFYFTTPRSLHEIMDRWVPWAQRLIGLLVGTGVGREKVRFFSHDATQPGLPLHAWAGSSAELLGQNPKSRRTLLRAPNSFDMIAPYPAIADQMPRVIAAWHRMDREMRPVLDLFGAVALHHALYAQAQFLFLVQALEVYYALSGKFKGKGRSWSVRLQEIFNAHADISDKLFVGSTKMAERIANTRNELTHGRKKKPPEDLLNETEMDRVTWSLEALLWIILLRELGIEGEPVQRLLRRALDAKFISLRT
jgi:hypothetical protein